MSKSQFIRETTITLGSSILSLFIGVGTSVILARVLGPEGKGIYVLATLLPSLIVTIGNLGIGPATAYYVARNEFSCREILGNNLLLSGAITFGGILAGSVLISFFREMVFRGVPATLLFWALAFIPLQVFFSNIRYVLLGARFITQYNLVQIVESIVFLALIAFTLLALKAYVLGAILAGLITWLIVDFITFRLTRKAVGGIELKPNTTYIKQSIKYGLQAHLSNILSFLNYRVDMFLVSSFLDPISVGLYSVGVGLVEKLWVVSKAASTVLFPRVAAESGDQRQNDFTPLVARSVLWTTTVGALILVFLSRWIVSLLYSDAYLPAVGALQALLPGIVALSAGRVLSNDIAGRGYPSLNIYTSIATVVTNVVLNIWWIPNCGIIGAALASTTSYTVSLLGSIFFYCRLSGNSWTKVVFFQGSDRVLYRETGIAFFQWLRSKMNLFLG